jgi:hypothetical protein
MDSRGVSFSTLKREYYTPRGWRTLWAWSYKGAGFLLIFPSKRARRVAESPFDTGSDEKAFEKQWRVASGEWRVTSGLKEKSSGDLHSFYEKEFSAVEQVAKQVEGEHGDHDGVTKEQKQIPRSARDDNIAILLRGAGRPRRGEEAEVAK